MRFRAYLLFMLPFAIAGFLAGAWFHGSTNAFQSWWLNVGLGAFGGMIVGDLVRVALRKGPAF